MTSHLSFKRLVSIGVLVGSLLALPRAVRANDENGVATPPGPGPSTKQVEGTGSLTTSFNQNNTFAGNTFDISNIGSMPVTITSFDVNCTGAAQTFTIYYRLDTALGHESDPAGWISFPVANNVNCLGINAATPVPTGGLTIQPGELRGFYVDLTSYTAGVSSLYYTNGGPTTFTNTELSLTTFHGKGNPAFTGASFFPRQWNGTVHYDIFPVELQSFGVE
jgi:hypothetical protein